MAGGAREAGMPHERRACPARGGPRPHGRGARGPGAASGIGIGMWLVPAPHPILLRLVART
eukprot:7223473-Prymnesium_polylepis.1